MNTAALFLVYQCVKHSASRCVFAVFFQVGFFHERTALQIQSSVGARGRSSRSAGFTAVQQAVCVGGVCKTVSAEEQSLFDALSILVSAYTQHPTYIGGGIV